MTYEELLLEAESLELLVKEKPLRGYNGRIKGNKIAIKRTLPTIAKKCTLVEELGHHHTTTGNILDQTDIRNRKQEGIARAWGYEKLIGIEKLIDAYKDGVQNRFELAEYLEVTEEYVEDVLKYYNKKYGSYFLIDKYAIQFIPLVVYEKVDFNHNT